MHHLRCFLLIVASGHLMLGCAPVGRSPSAVSDQDESSAMPIAPPDQTPPSPERTHPPSARPSSAENLRVCPPKGAALGADVSDFNPNTNWVQYKNAGRTFTFIKATEGLTVIDDLFAGDWKAAKKAGVLRGAYHFFHPHDNPLTAANTFLKTMGSLDVDDLPPMLDWEVSDGISASKQAAAAKVWLDRVEEVTGRVPILYIGPSYWNSLGNPQGFERYPLFLAHYGVSCPSVPPPWSQWLFWQKGQGAVTGVQADSVDLDLFFGSLADLVAALALGQTLP